MCHIFSNPNMMQSEESVSLFSCFQVRITFSYICNWFSTEEVILQWRISCFFSGRNIFFSTTFFWPRFQNVRLGTVCLLWIVDSNTIYFLLACYLFWSSSTTERCDDEQNLIILARFTISKNKTHRDKRIFFLLVFLKHQVESLDLTLH